MLFKAIIAAAEKLTDNRCTTSTSPSSKFDAQEQQCRTFTMGEVATHCHHNDCWVVISDKVYDITNFLHEHPGGSDIVIEYAGRDATLAYKGVGHTKIEELLETLCIGTLCENDWMCSEYRREERSDSTCSSSSSCSSKSMDTAGDDRDCI